MSINAIGSVSLYEYYYQINNDEKKKKNSPLEKEMREYGLAPTDNEALNISMLKQAKMIELSKQKEETQETISYSDRPWADLMYQLNISFNEDPQDDIQDIKDELALLMRGVEDEELAKEINDLEGYVERLYLNFQSNNSGGIDRMNIINTQLNNLAMVNQIGLL